MKPTDLALNRALGLVEAPAGAQHLLEMPLAPLVQNHVGTAHAAAQFALAEAASAACLQREFGPAVGEVFAVVRGSTLKFRKPATRGSLLAFAQTDEFTRQNLIRDLATRTRTTANVLVELKDLDGNVTFTGSFQWFIARAESTQEATS
jgi:acyl-coenzyme A thioesterase PaaI-like protein